MKSSNTERGALIPMLALGLVVVLIMGLVVVGVTNEAHRRAQAQTAADAVALAGAAGGRPEAERMAAVYEANLTELTIDGTRVYVVLLLDGVTAVAQASRQLVATE